MGARTFPAAFSVASPGQQPSSSLSSSPRLGLCLRHPSQNCVDFCIDMILLSYHSVLSLLWVSAVVSVASAQVAQPTSTPQLRFLSNSELDAPRLDVRQQQGTTTSSANVNIPQDAPAGGLTFTQPAVTASVSYYKVAAGNPITFGWSYTSLYVTPSALTFEARCSANSFTYPVGPATGIPGTQMSIVWDPYAYQQSPGAIPFAQASYTLHVYDERGAAATAEPGLFNGDSSQVIFAMYSPAAYTPLASGWVCVTCNSWGLGQLSSLSHPLLVALPVTVALILIGGAGVLNR